MPGSPSFTPKSVKPSISTKRFTVAEANKTLPLVSRIVADIVKSHDRALQLQAKLEAEPNSKSAGANQAELDKVMDRLQSFVSELADIGVELKDYQTGLIDFVGSHRGRDVYLCWKLGEDKIAFWHEMNTGFAGRKSVNALDEREQV